MTDDAILKCLNALVRNLLSVCADGVALPPNSDVPYAIHTSGREGKKLDDEKIRVSKSSSTIEIDRKSKTYILRVVSLRTRRKFKLM